MVTLLQEPLTSLNLDSIQRLEKELLSRAIEELLSTPPNPIATQLFSFQRVGSKLRIKKVQPSDYWKKED